MTKRHNSIQAWRYRKKWLRPQLHFTIYTSIYKGWFLRAQIETHMRKVDNRCMREREGLVLRICSNLRC